MRLSFGRNALALAGGIALAMSWGCSSDPVTSATAGLTVRYVPGPTGTGRYEQATFEIKALRMVPSDPVAQELLGNQELTMRFQPYLADLTSTQKATYAQIALSSGTYVITAFELAPPQLTDENVPATPATCLDGITTLPSGPAGSQVPNSYLYDEASGLQFTVSPGQTQVEIAVDVPGLISDYESAFTCEPDCGGGPCLTAFDADAFGVAFLANVTIQ